LFGFPFINPSYAGMFRGHAGGDEAGARSGSARLLRGHPPDAVCDTAIARKPLLRPGTVNIDSKRLGREVVAAAAEP
jgi:hypothetical protein